MAGPKKRKYPSGAQKRKAKEQQRQADIVALSAKAEPLGVVLVDRAELEALQAAAAGRQVADDDGAAEFAKIGAPPIEDADTALGWVRKHQLVALHLVTTRPLSKELLERVRWVKDLGFTTGSTHGRATVEDRLKRVEGELTQVKAARGAVVMERADQVSRPATARGGRRPRGLRPVSGPGPGAPQGEDR